MDYESDAKHGESETSSSDDEHKWKQEIKDQYRQIQKEKKAKARLEKFKNNSSNGKSTITDNKNGLASDVKQPKFFEIKDGFEYFSKDKKNSNDLLKTEKMKKLPLQNRLKFTQEKEDKAREKEEEIIYRHDSFGNKQMTFLSKRAKRDKEAEKKAQEHHMERKVLRRSAGKITKSFQNKQNYSRRPK
jgi:hypothetical protein